MRPIRGRWDLRGLSARSVALCGSEHRLPVAIVIAEAERNEEKLQAEIQRQKTLSGAIKAGVDAFMNASKGATLQCVSRLEGYATVTECR